MEILIGAFLIVACLVEVYSFFVCCRSGNGMLGIVFVALAIVATALAIYLTYVYEYFPDSNTRVIGWPIPSAILKREEPDGPWVDYVGWGVLVSPPIYVVAILFVPAALLLKVGLCRTHAQPRGSTGQGLG